MFSVMD